MLAENSNMTCESCWSFHCCKEIGSPFFLTQYDIDKIKAKKQLKENEFRVKKLFRHRALNFLRQKESGECVFFSDGKCQIYPFRPLDCRLFPLDLHYRNGQYIWIKYHLCQGLVLPLDRQLEKAELEILPLLSNDLEIYTDLEFGLFDKKEWEELRPVKFEV